MKTERPIPMLQKLIQEVRAELGNGDPALKRAVEGLKETIEEKLTALYEADNLRIFDGKEGGVIQGPRNSRKSNENPKTHKVLCQEKNFEGNYQEVPYFRAAFNSPCHTLTIDTDSEQELDIRLIGYESPLMRKKNEKQNKDIKRRAISCDLVGLTSDNHVMCIEGKVNPHGDDTDIVYGLLEGFAYAVCIEYFLSDDTRRCLFDREVQACLDYLHQDSNSFENKLPSSFSLAAPKEYFGEYLTPATMGDKKAKDRLAEAERVLDAFSRIEGAPAWGGFLVMDPPCNRASFDEEGHEKIGNKVEPHFKSGFLKVALAKSIDELKELALRGTADKA